MVKRVGKGAPLRWVENKVLARHLHGLGIEIGALWRRFPVPARVSVWYVDRYDSDALAGEYPEVGVKIVPPDVAADATSLPFRYATLDFIIASHLLEHLPFPLKGLRHWYALLRSGGTLLLKIPDKRFTFDQRRECTTLQHLIAEDAEPENFDRRAHFRDWIKNSVEQTLSTKDLERETDRLMKTDYSIHYHVWTDRDVRELVEYTQTAMNLSWQPVQFFGGRFYRKECSLVLRKD